MGQSQMNEAMKLQRYTSKPLESILVMAVRTIFTRVLIQLNTIDKLGVIIDLIRW
jgi:hypothetical protein